MAGYPTTNNVVQQVLRTNWYFYQNEEGFKLGLVTKQNSNSLILNLKTPIWTIPVRKIL
jgi:hypothetical protein